MYFNCDVTDDVRTFTHNTQHLPEHMRESTVQAVNLGLNYSDKSVKLKNTNLKQVYANFKNYETSKESECTTILS